MGKFYESVIRPTLFRQDAETAHEQGVAFMRFMSKLPWFCRLMESRNLRPRHSEPIKLFGLEFPNRVGLAAGMDKNAACWPAAAAFGFGHVEIGTITYHRQPGNPRPRVFRYPEHEAVINRMGFNNEGAQFVAARLAKQNKGLKRRIPLGINIGKSKKTSIEDAADDYLQSFNLLAEYADYFTINVSSPNTPDLRKLQGSEHLPTLLKVLADANNDRSERLGVGRLPILLKIAPDLSYREIDGILETMLALGYDGIIATNTTLARPGPFADVDQAGGLSGTPVDKKSTDIIRYISRSTESKLPIIGVGGIMDAKSAGDKIAAGASLVQIYTGFIYRGPLFPRDVAMALSHGHREWF
ncbi:MAG: quinone-dependent dihydroorotate dehydrogenase [Opitutales bacterium]|jgi:dihydroorotate dehydrogenase|nr:quinone-dependent dihydroorotate dehydrogenase [Opitutales bacterium]MDG2168773.1 quinone-dependent dihydroorotate dehydrogenase [Opitutales bacterium]